MSQNYSLANIVDQLRGTPGLLLTLDASGELVPLAPPGVAGYVLTSDPAASIGIKWDAAGGGGSLPTLAASKLIVTDGAGALTTSNTPTLAELNFLTGVTSAIQTQLNSKAASSHTHTIANVTNLQATLDAKAPAATGATGVSKYYGTDASGNVGFFTLPSGSGGGVGDMLKAVYDTNNDGIVDTAAVALSVAWTDISGKPTAFVTNLAALTDSFAKGDMLYAASAGSSVSLTKRSIGTVGQVLTVDATGIPVWATSTTSLPSQFGNSGKYLTTNGTSASWAFPYIQTLTGQHYSNNGARINKLADRLFVGDSVTDDGAYPSSARDWLSSWYHSVLGYDSGARALAKFTTLELAESAVAIHAGSQSQYFNLGTGYTAGTACIGIQSYVLNNAIGGPTYLQPGQESTPGHWHHAWCYYGEAHRQNNYVGAVFGMELGVVESGASPVVQTPYTQGTSEGLRITAGVGHTAGTYDCSAAIGIYTNPKSFKSGIVFEAAAVAKTDNIRPVMVMAPEHALTWYASAGNLGPYIKSECISASTGQRLILSDNQFTIQNFAGTGGFYFNSARNGVWLNTSSSSGSGRNNGEIWFDGIHLYCLINGVVKQLDN